MSGTWSDSRHDFNLNGLFRVIFFGFWSQLNLVVEIDFFWRKKSPALEWDLIIENNFSPSWSVDILNAKKNSDKKNKRIFSNENITRTKFITTDNISLGITARQCSLIWFTQCSLPASKSIRYVFPFRSPDCNGRKQVNWQAKKVTHTKKNDDELSSRNGIKKYHNQFVAAHQTVCCRISVQLCRSVQLELVLSLNVKQSIFIKRISFALTKFNARSIIGPRLRSKQTIDFIFYYLIYQAIITSCFQLLLCHYWIICTLERSTYLFSPLKKNGRIFQEAQIVKRIRTNCYSHSLYLADELSD